MASPLQHPERTSRAARRALLVWEQGGALGHHAALGTLARHLQARGVEVHAAVQRVSDAPEWFPAGVPLHASPAPPRTPRGEPDVTYADVLSGLGWRHPRKLGKVVQQWRTLVDAVDPDVVVLNSAPTVHLALHGGPRRIVGFGAPFFAQPPVRPLPPLEWWRPALPDGAAREQPVLDTANALRLPGSPALVGLADLWSDTRWILHGPAELDPWWDLRPPGTLHAGITAVLDRGGAPDWPAGDGPRVFAYLKPGFRYAPDVLAALERHGCRTVAFIPRDPDSRTPATPRTHVVREPLSIDAVRREADLVVTHSALTTGCAFLEAGVPGLFLPMHLEQLGSGRCASMRLKGAATLPIGAVDTQLDRALRMILHPAVRQATIAQMPRFERYRDPWARIADVVVG
ncbi:MAG: hypothetical protein R3F61_22930 [Myxococcota bacterium]